MVWAVFLILSTTLQPGGVFLMISPGAAQVGMGMGGVAYPNDIPGIYYNPANVNLTGTGIYIQNTPILEPWNYLFSEVTDYYKKKDIPYSPDWLSVPGMKYMYGGIKFPSLGFNPFSQLTVLINIGMNYTYLTTGETEVEINGQMYKFEDFDYAIGIPIGISFFDNIINVGITPKYVYSLLAPQNILEAMGDTTARGYANAFTYDAGVLLKDPFGFGSIGLSYSNIIGFLSYMKDNSGRDNLPRFVRFGYSISPIVAIKKYLNLPFDLTKIFDVRYSGEKLTDRVGTEHDFWDSRGREITLLNTIIFREGYFSDTLGSRVGKTDGIGIRLGNITMDYGNDSEIYTGLFHIKNYRLSMSMHSLEGENKYYAIPLSILFPGAGHMYLGMVKKGLIYGGIATLVSLVPPYGSKSKNKILSGFFYSLSLASVIDIFWDVKK